MRYPRRPMDHGWVRAYATQRLKTFASSEEPSTCTRTELRQQLAEDIAQALQSGELFVLDGKGRRYLVSVQVNFIPAPEE